jgi:glycosyltransferase involved in cell wall biosynthesis
MIHSAVESALSQRTTFKVEILISEDASTDGTRDIVKAYAEVEPERIRLLLSDQNLKSNEVVARGLCAARGRYIALLDGDDLWTNDGKLQRQADYLDQRPECALCFHHASIWHGDKPSSDLWTRRDQSPISTLEDLWRGNPFATSSSMMRATFVRNVPDWYRDFFPITDWPLYLLCAQHGSIGFINEVMSAYRLHEGGQFTALPSRAKLDAVAAFYRRMNACLEYRYDRLARSGASQYFFEWAEEYARQGDKDAARGCLWRSFAAGGIGLAVSYGAATRLALRLLPLAANRHGARPR